MAGGTWMSQNKVQPGVYINTKSSGNLSASIGEKGIVAIAEPLSWGPCEVMQTIIPGEDLTPTSDMTSRVRRQCSCGR